MSPNAALRIVSLPSEMANAYDVSSFVSTELGFGEVVWVNIVNMMTDRGVSYRTAFVDITRTPENAPRANDLLNDFIFPSNGRFHFDNGKPMDHLKIVACKRNKPSVDPLVLEEGEWSSLYLPIVPKDLSLDNGDVQYDYQFALYEFFEDHLKLGKVDRIDYTPRPDGQRSAFVHFEYWFDNPITKKVRNVIDAFEQFTCTGYYDGFEFSKFDNGGYLVLKKDTQGLPVKDNTADEMDADYPRFLHDLEREAKKPLPPPFADPNTYWLKNGGNSAMMAHYRQKAMVDLARDKEHLLRINKEEYARTKMLRKELADLNVAYESSSQNVASMTMSMMKREQKLKELEAEIKELKSFSMVPVPGMDVMLDVGNILAENHRMKEASAKPLPLNQAFKQLRVSLDEAKSVSAKLLAEYGTSSAIQDSGILGTAEYKDFAFDYIGEIMDIYDEFVPEIWR
jgi:hypothetical protein